MITAHTEKATGGFLHGDGVIKQGKKEVKDWPAELFQPKKKYTASQKHCCDRHGRENQGESRTEGGKKHLYLGNHAQGSRCLSKQGAASLNRVGPPCCPHYDDREGVKKKRKKKALLPIDGAGGKFLTGIFLFIFLPV